MNINMNMSSHYNLYQAGLYFSRPVTVSSSILFELGLSLKRFLKQYVHCLVAIFSDLRSLVNSFFEKQITTLYSKIIIK